MIGSAIEVSTPTRVRHEHARRTRGRAETRDSRPSEELASLSSGPAIAALAGILAGGTPRRFAGSALRAGGLISIGRLAHGAWSRYEANRLDAHARFCFRTPRPLSAEDFRLTPAMLPLILRAMVGAAHADGHLDAAERRHIVASAPQIGLNDACAARLRRELATPLPPEAVAHEVSTLAHACAIHLASSFVLNRLNPLSRAHLDRLAEGLGLPNGLAEEIERTAETQTLLHLRGLNPPDPAIGQRPVPAGDS